MNDTEQRLCQEPGCDRSIGAHGARGYCPMHYKRLLRQGNPSVAHPNRSKPNRPNRMDKGVSASRAVHVFDGDPAAKRRARVRLRNAVSGGHIQRKPCQECSAPKVEAHHYLGYDGEHWKDVMWLCKFHHLKLHGLLTESYVKQVEGALNV
jgi:hypothetical protein